MVSIDSTGNFNRSQHRIFVLMAHSFAGALPLSIVITTSEKSIVLARRLQLLVDFLGNDTFYGKKAPNIIVINHSTSERNGIAQVFPSATLLLCTFHILQSLWRYIWKNESGISKENEPLIYSLVHKLVYEKDMDTMVKNYQNIIQSSLLNRKMKKYLNNLWDIREEWGHSYRTDIMCRGNQTNNYAELTMRLLKDKIFNRQKAYNIVQLIDFICTRLDIYYEKKLLDRANGREISVQTRYRLQFSKVNDLEVIKGCDNITFLVRNKKNMTEYYIDVESGICSCFIGCTGAPCKHQAAVLHHFPRESNNFLTGSNEQRRLLHTIANSDVTISQIIGINH